MVMISIVQYSESLDQKPKQINAHYSVVSLVTTDVNRVRPYYTLMVAAYQGSV